MEQEERFMIVKIGREHYGIKINEVKEVVSNTEITNVPDKQSVYICGIMKCRYGCISVFDIYKLFNIEPAPVLNCKQIVPPTAKNPQQNAKK